MFSLSWYRFPVTLLSKKIQHQLILPTTPLNSHYHLLGAMGRTVTTLGTFQIDIHSGWKVWPTPAIVVSSLTQSLILGLNFLKLTKPKIDFKTNTVETGSKIHSADTHCITSSSCTIIIPTSDVYWPFQLLLNQKACWVVIFTLITVVVLMTDASHTYCHFRSPFKKHDKCFIPPARNLTWKELLAYSYPIRFTLGHNLWIQEE